VAIIYRPGSGAVTALFFKYLSDVLDRLVTFIDPGFAVGDFNVRLDRPSDPVAGQFNERLTTYGLVSHVTTVTHDRGGILDTVARRNDLPSPHVDVIDVGLSDHRLLRWSTALVRPCPIYTSFTRRSNVGHGANVAAFEAALRPSPLCNSSSWSSLIIDDFAALYDNEVSNILDRLIPFSNRQMSAAYIRPVVRRRLSSG